MTDEQLIEEAAKSLCRTNWGDEFTFEEDREYWVNQARAAFAVFEKATNVNNHPETDISTGRTSINAPTAEFYEGLAAARRTLCIRAVPGSVIPCCGVSTDGETTNHEIRSHHD